jgi:nucleoside phosphorylase
MRLEVQRFIRRMDLGERMSVGEFPVMVGECHGRPVMVCYSGIGRRAGEAAGSVLRKYRPDAVASVGLGGALSPECVVGDIVLCEWIYRSDPTAADAKAEDPLLSDPKLLDVARRAAEGEGLRSWTGGCLTVSEVIAEPHRKTVLRDATGLDVVEMESYWVGEAARQARVPFVAARAVLDEVDHRLPDIPGVISPDGEQHAYRALPHLLRNPWRLPELVRTARSGSRAVDRLTRFLEGFVVAMEIASAGEAT